jgi:hypothetical protein
MLAIGHTEQFLSQELHYTANDLLVFIDDTGHESFAGNQEYYGLGGCVVLGAAYHHLKTQWSVVRDCIKGSDDAPHAAKMVHNDCNFHALSTFFQDRSFARLAVASTKRTTLPANMHPATPVTAALQEDIVHLATIIPCASVMLIVESSQRSDAILKQCLVDLVPEGVGLAIPVTHCLMPKSSAEPGLEIADFIINAAGSQTKRYMRDQDGFARDFSDIFRRLPSIGCLFSLINEIEIHSNGRVRIQRLRLVGNTHFRRFSNHAACLCTINGEYWLTFSASKETVDETHALYTLFRYNKPSDWLA